MFNTVITQDGNKGNVYARRQTRSPIFIKIGEDGIIDIDNISFVEKSQNNLYPGCRIYLLGNKSYLFTSLKVEQVYSLITKAGQEGKLCQN